MNPDPHAPFPDADLLPRVAAGDRAAFGELYRRFRVPVYRFALHMTGSQAAAEDVTQDVFMIVMRDAGRFDPGRSVPLAWLLGIARNCVRRRAEKERPLVPIPGETETGDLGMTVPSNQMADLIRAASIERIRKAILTLPLHYREAIVLCELQEMSYAEAAAAIGCAMGTVRSRVHRGRQMLAVKLRAAATTQETPLKMADGRCLA